MKRDREKLERLSDTDWFRGQLTCELKFELDKRWDQEQEVTLFLQKKMLCELLF
jgi:hypothetical protein